MKRLRPWLLIILGGILLPISFCGFDQWYLTWIAFVPLLGALEGASRRQALWRGFVYGLIANMIGYYWIPQTIYEFGKFPLILAWTFGVILCSYQGLQYALLSYITVRLREKKYPLLIVFPSTMVALETVYPLLFPIFMGNTQHKIPLLIQAADLLGPLLITMVIMLFNASIYVLLRSLLEGKAKKKGIPWRQALVGPMGLIALIVYGAIRIPMIDAEATEGTDLTVGIVQPSMGIEEKWSDVEEGLRRHNESSLELEERGADLIIWSEASYTAGYIRPEPMGNLRRIIVPELRTPLLFGALTLHHGPNQQRIRHNSALMLDSEGHIVGTYDKTYLLAFGEYLPFGNVFPQLHAASPNSGRLQQGTSIDAIPLSHEGRHWNLGVLICYEDILPGFTRDLVQHASPHLLVNMTNDAWFGDTNEPWIHMDLSKFRAVEHRRYLLRATNTGVSAIIDPVGRVIENTEVFVQATLLSTVKLLDGGPTLYQILGDILGYLSLLFVGFGLVRTRQVWLRGPGDPKAKLRAGITQPIRLLLAIAVLDALSIVFVLLTSPAGWQPSALELVLWCGSHLAMVMAFVTLRRGNNRGLLLAYGGTGARLILSILLITTTTEEHLGSVWALVGIPMAFAVVAAITLFLWRERCELVNQLHELASSDAKGDDDTGEANASEKKDKSRDKERQHRAAVNRSNRKTKKKKRPS